MKNLERTFPHLSWYSCQNRSLGLNFSVDDATVNTIIEKTRLVAFVETTAGYNVHIRTKEFDLIYACRARKSRQVLQVSFEELNPRRQQITRDIFYQFFFKREEKLSNKYITAKIKNLNHYICSIQIRYLKKSCCSQFKFEIHLMKR